MISPPFYFLILGSAALFLLAPGTLTALLFVLWFYLDAVRLVLLHEEVHLYRYFVIAMGAGLIGAIVTFLVLG